MHKLIHNNISSSRINVFKFNNQVHCRETRGHKYKLFFNRNNKLVFSNFFTNRIISIWNHLSDSCFNGDTLFYFKNQLHNTDFSCFFFVWSLIVVIMYNVKMCECFWRLLVAFPLTVVYYLFLVSMCFVLYQ